jgi:hypothetical protein
MLTIEEYKEKFPNEKCWGHTLIQPGVRFIKEGLLQFTESSAKGWAGPFEGSYAQFHCKDYSNAIVLSGPNKGQNWLQHLAKHKEAKAEITKRSNLYYGKDRHKDRHVRKVLPYSEDPSIKYPIKLWMAGNDDTSYSKCYKTEQDFLNELELFIANEPLDFKQVIEGFNFIFTN